MNFKPYEKIACVLAHIIGLGGLFGLMWEQAPILYGILVFGGIGSVCTFCLGLPFPPVWVPFFWLLTPLFWLIRPLYRRVSQASPIESTENHRTTSSGLKRRKTQIQPKDSSRVRPISKLIRRRSDE